METITTSSGQIILCRAKPAQILNRIHNLLSTRLFHGDADLLTACYKKITQAKSAVLPVSPCQFRVPSIRATYNYRMFLPAELALDWKKSSNLFCFFVFDRSSHPEKGSSSTMQHVSPDIHRQTTGLDEETDTETSFA